MPLRERERLRVLHEAEQEHWTQVEAAQRSKRTDRGRRFAAQKGRSETRAASRGAVHLFATLDAKGWKFGPAGFLDGSACDFGSCGR